MDDLSNLVQRYYEEGKYKQAEDIIDFAYNNEPTPIADKICLGIVLKAMGKGNYAVAKQFLLKSVHFNATGIAEDLLAFIKQLEMSSGGSELRAQTRESIANDGDNDKPSTSRDTAVVKNREMENLKQTETSDYEAEEKNKNSELLKTVHNGDSDLNMVKQNLPLRNNVQTCIVNTVALSEIKLSETQNTSDDAKTNAGDNDDSNAASTSSAGDLNKTKMLLDKAEKSTKGETPTIHPSEINEMGDEKCVDNDCCAICLGAYKDKCFTDPCLHPFCFDCIVPWSKEKPDCPLCQQTFKSIMHNIRPSGQYDVYEVKAVQRGVGSAAPAAAQGGEEGKQGLTEATTSSFAPSAPAQPSRPREVTSRHEVYSNDLWAIPLPFPMRHRGFTPKYYRDNVDEAKRVLNWIYDDLQAATGKDRSSVTAMCDMNLLFKRHIGSDEFQDALEPYLGDRSQHFLHEVLCFASSLVKVECYHSVTLYSTKSNAMKSPGARRLYAAVHQWFSAYSPTTAMELHTRLNGPRSKVYSKDLWAIPLQNKRKLESTSTKNITRCDRLWPWIDRELLELLYDNHRTLIPAAKKRIEQLLPRYHVTSPQFRNAMRLYLRDHTEHFQHELYSFACSGVPLLDYDEEVTYSYRREAWRCLDVVHLFRDGGCNVMGTN